MKWITISEILSENKFTAAVQNYRNNRSIGIKKLDDPEAESTDAVTKNSEDAARHSTVTEVSGKKLLYCQHGGNFPKMRFARAKMSNVICEAIAIYNALKFSGYIDDDKDFEEFFKISCEFEVNAQYIITGGHWGTDYKRLGEFLNSRSIPFKIITDTEKADAMLKNAKCAVISYKFYLFGVHTFMCFYDSGKVISVNRGSGCLYLWKNKSIKECLRGQKLAAAYLIY